jgi:hypothetical protein
MTLTRYIDRRNNMKISKIAVAVLFAAGFVTIPASLGLAETQDQDDLMVIQCINEYTEEKGYKCIDTTPEDEAVAYTPEVGDVDVKPIDSCWTTEDGTEVCSRSVEPMPATGEETPVDGGVCDSSGLVDSEGNQPEQCWYDVRNSGGVPVDSEGAILEKGAVDETLMYQSGVATGAPDQTVSNALAAFGVLVGALGALGIGLSRQRAAEK